MSFSSLPPELLHVIVDYPGGPLPSRTLQAHRERLSTLCSLSLVHSSLRSRAQLSLVEELWLDILRHEPFSMGKVGWLHIDQVDSAICALSQRAKNLWIDFVWDDLAFEYLAKYNAPLETLEVTYWIDHAPDDKTWSLPCLSRLVLGNLWLGGRFLREGDRRFFSPTTFPNLKHLALGMEERCEMPAHETLALLLPQLTTLAIASHRSHYSPEERAHFLDVFRTMVDSVPVLEHLSLDSNLPTSGRSVFLDCLFHFATGFCLKTLHLGVHHLQDPTLAARLLKVAKGEKEAIQVDKVVIYGSCAEFRSGIQYSEAFYWVETKCIEGVEGRTAPFAEFVGII